jgi:3-hydroxybutyryl-CoA dehydrogenase
MTEGLETKKIHTVAVVGGGTMGVGLARTLAGAGLEVLLCEKDEQASEKADSSLRQELDREESRWGLTGSEKQAILRRTHMVWRTWETARAELVIESVNEDFDLKIEVFRSLDEVCEPEIIFVTNTSTLSVSELGASTKRPSRFVGMHFINPVPKTKVAEVIRGTATTDETVETVKDFAVSIGKTPIEVNEYPGYVTTRVILPMINEAIHVVMEGVATAEDVDKAMKLGYSMEAGPLSLADRMGLDEVKSWLDHLFDELGELKYRPCPLLRRMVRAGKLGIKTGEGFFKYE